MLVPMALFVLILAVVILFLQTRVLRIRCAALEEAVKQLQTSNPKLPATSLIQKRRTGTNKNNKHIDSVPLHKLVRQMSSSDSFPTLKLRKHGGDDFFIGHQVVSWLCRHYNLSRSSSIKTCQKLMDNKLLEHENGEETFKDSTDEYYRFTDGDSESSPTSYLFRLSNSMKSGLAEDHMEGYLEIFTLAFWHKNYFIQSGDKLEFYDTSPKEGGLHLGSINLSKTKILNVKKEYFSFEMSSETVDNIFEFEDDKDLPDITVLSKLAGPTCYLRVCNSNENQAVEFTDWLLVFDQLEMLTMEPPIDSTDKDIRAEDIADYNAEELSAQMTNQEEEFVSRTLESLKQNTNIPISSEDILRFFRARNGKEDAACAMLNSYIEWASDFRPWETTFPIIEKVANTKIARIHYYDTHGSPCIVVTPRNHSKKDRDVQLTIRFIIYLVEEAIRRAGAPYTTKLVAIFDYSKFTRKNSDLEFAKALITTMNKYYPERLRRVFVINQPWTLSLMWSVVEPLIDPDTRKKVTFIKKAEQLSQFFSKEHLLKEHGGNSEIRSAGDPLGFDTLDGLNQ